MAPKRSDEKPDMDSKTAIPLDPVEAMRALLQVDPESDDPEPERSPKPREEPKPSRRGA